MSWLFYLALFIQPGHNDILDKIREIYLELPRPVRRETFRVYLKLENLRNKAIKLYEQILG